MSSSSSDQPVPEQPDPISQRTARLEKRRLSQPEISPTATKAPLLERQPLPLRASDVFSDSEMSEDESATGIDDLTREVTRLTKLVEEQGKSIVSLQAIVSALQKSGRPAPPVPPITNNNPIIMQLQQQINAIAAAPRVVTNHSPQSNTFNSK